MLLTITISSITVFSPFHGDNLYFIKSTLYVLLSPFWSVCHPQLSHTIQIMQVTTVPWSLDYSLGIFALLRSTHSPLSKHGLMLPSVFSVMVYNPSSHCMN